MPKTFPSEEPFSGTSLNLDLEIPTAATGQSSLRNEITIGTQVGLASLAWAAATNFSTAIMHNESIKAGLKTVRFPMIYSGLPAMLTYNLGPVEIAIAAQKKVLGQEENLSAGRAALSVLTGAGVEAVAGNPLDFLSLRQILHSVKASHHLQTNPADMAKFSQEELRRLIPTNAKIAPDKEAIIKSAAESKYSNISFTPQNLKLISEKLGVKLTVADVAKSIGIMCPTSILRNLPFYAGLLEANKPQGQNSHIYETMLISLGGALMTTIPNNATYQSALGTVKGKEPLPAFTGALSESLQQVWKDPKKFTALVGIRALATFSAVLCFSDSTQNSIQHMVDGISDSISQNLGFGNSLNLTAAEKETVDKKITKAISESQEGMKPDAAPTNPQNTKLATIDAKAKSK